VAAPDDVHAERARLEKVVRELNAVWSDDNGVQLELANGRTPADKSGKSDTDYQIFVGILWTRATGIDEFRAAYKKWQSDAGSVALMVYFKDERVAPSKLNAAQLAVIQQLRNELRGLSDSHRTFSSPDEFETQARLDLLRAVEQVRAKVSTEAAGLDGSDLTLEETEDGELGFLDYMELTEEAIARQAAALERATAAMTQIGSKIQKRITDSDTAGGQGMLKGGRAAVRQAFEQGAADLNDFSAATLSEIPRLSQAHLDVLRALAGAAALAVHFGTGGRDQAMRVLRQLDSSSDGITMSRTQIPEFRTRVAGFPRMMMAFNKARARALDALDALDGALGGELSRNEQIRGEIQHLLQKRFAESRAEARPETPVAPPVAR